MKITLISNSLNCGGAERQIVYLAGLLKQQGHNICFVCINKGTFYEKILESYGLKANYQYAEQFSFALKKKHRIIRELYKLITKIKLIVFIATLKSDVTISYLELSNRINCISSLIHNCKVITGERNAIRPVTKSLAWRYYKFLMGRSDYIVCNSEVANKMWQEIVPSYAIKLKTIYNIVYKPIILQDIKYEVRKNGKLKIVVPASYDNTRKNYTGLVSALQLIPNKYKKSFHIDWYGNINTTIENSKVYNETMAIVRNNNLGEMISFHNKVSNIGEIMETADIVAIFSHVEGLPNGICEAMSLGKPIIMTKVSDYRMLVGSNGFLCESRDPRSICNCIIRAVNLSNQDILNMGKCSKEMFNSLFSVDASLIKWNSLIN